MSITVSNIISELEKLAPLKIAEDGDNVGLLIGDKNKKVNKILLALDVTFDVVEEAINKNIDMIVAHHPIIYRKISRVNTNSVLGNKLIKLIKADIAVYASHTNLDSANNGLSDVFAKKLGIENTEILEQCGLIDSYNMYGIGRIATVSEITLNDFVKKIKEQLNINHLRVVGDINKKINKVALAQGSAMDFASSAYENGADVFVTGDIKYHDAQEYLEKGMALVDAGHFATENIVLDLLYNYINDIFNADLSIYKSKCITDPFTFL